MMGATMIGPMSYSWENGAQHGGHGFCLRLSSLKGFSLQTSQLYKHLTYTNIICGL